MRNVYDFTVYESEFLGFLFNYRKSLIIDKTAKVEIGNYARIFEFYNDSYVGTGRHLLFEILNIGEIKGIDNTRNIHYIDLKKIATE